MKRNERVSLQNQKPLKKTKRGNFFLFPFEKAPFLLRERKKKQKDLLVVSCALPPFSFLLMRVLLRVWKRNEKKRKETKRNERVSLQNQRPLEKKRKGATFFFFLCAAKKKNEHTKTNSYPLKEKKPSFCVPYRRF